jgi:ABC-type branched-subunit amino acid transport system substrate-binding protein
MSGPQGDEGLSEERGASLAADWVNQHAGVDGRRIAITAVDAPRAESVPSAMARLQAERISLVVGTHGSTISAVAAPEAQRRHMLLWETGAIGEINTPGSTDWQTMPTQPVGPSVGQGQSFFRMSPSGSSLGRSGIDFVITQLSGRLPAHGPLRVAVAYVEDPYGRSVKDGVLAGVRADGAQLAGVFPYQQTGTDWPQLVQAIARSGANVLYASSYLDDGMALRRATLAAHLPLIASVGTSSSYCLPAFGQRLQAAAVGLFASDKPAGGSINQGALLPEGQQTLAWAQAEWTKRYGGTMDAYATSGFANAYALFAHVLPASRAATPAGVAAAATTTKLPAGSLADGSGIDFPAARSAQAGTNQAAVSVIWEWVAPGQEAVVWPPTFATHPILALPIDQ